CCRRGDGVLPNFIIIGAMKAGTTSLFQYLRQHPQVFMPDMKEPHFFSAEHNWHRGRGWYEELFEEAGPAVAVGEASTGYTKHPIYQGIPERMAKMLPEVRLIYLMRHPIERMQSQYLDQTTIRDDHPLLEPESRSLRKALTSDPSYLSFSMYAMQIEQYLDFFAREQLLLLTSDEFRQARRPTLHKVFSFLGVDPHYAGAEQHEEFNQSEGRTMRKPLARKLRQLPGYRRLTRPVPTALKKLHYRFTTTEARRERVQIPDDLRAHLEELLRDDVRRLRTYMPADFHGWGIG
ncbi:MAG: sulfotransferase domain-containing protein, partial [Actinomycetota bacterium]|nr:sulfotransferase domain-containing protein [Actinomycetota bacterium]